MGERRDDWKGGKFILISLAVTTASIIFFFAGRHFFSKIEPELSVAWKGIARRAAEWGGIQLRTIELNVITADEHSSKPDPVFQNLTRQLRERLSVYYGQPFWLLDLGKIKGEILHQGWPKSVFVRRSFPDSLKIQIVTRTPALLIHSSRWVLADEDGHFMLQTHDIPGAFVHLPIVYGLEEECARVESLEEMNRSYPREREVLQDVLNLLSVLKEKVRLSVNSIHLAKEDWTDETLITIRFSPADVDSDVEDQAVFLSHHWADRMDNFQFVLSDLHHRSGAYKILGQYTGKWFVQLSSAAERR